MKTLNAKDTTVRDIKVETPIYKDWRVTEELATVYAEHHICPVCGAVMHESQPNLNRNNITYQCWECNSSIEVESVQKLIRVYMRACEMVYYAELNQKFFFKDYYMTKEEVTGDTKHYDFEFNEGNDLREFHIEGNTMLIDVETPRMYQAEIDVTGFLNDLRGREMVCPVCRHTMKIKEDGCGFHEAECSYCDSYIRAGAQDLVLFNKGLRQALEEARGYGYKDIDQIDHIYVVGDYIDVYYEETCDYYLYGDREIYLKEPEKYIERVSNPVNILDEFPLQEI